MHFSISHPQGLCAPLVLLNSLRVGLGEGRLPACLLEIRCGGGAAPGREAAELPCDLGGREEPISRARGGQGLFTHVILEHSPKVTVFSLKKKASRHRQQRPGCLVWALLLPQGPMALAQLPNLGLATNPRARAAARSRARRLRMHVTTCSLSLDSSQLTCKRFCLKDLNIIL